MENSTEHGIKELSKESIIEQYEAREKQLKSNNNELHEENCECHKIINELEIELQSYSSAADQCKSPMKTNKDCIDDQKIDIKNLQAHLVSLIKEKEQIIKAVENEEEYMTNKLQKRLSCVLKEKIDIEKRLEAEQEQIVNKLQKQLEESSTEKEKLEKQLNVEKHEQRNLISNLEEEHNTITEVKYALGKIHKEKRDLEMKLSEEIQQNEEIISMLENERGLFTSTFQRKLKSLRHDKKRLKAKITLEEMSLIDTLQTSIQNLLNDNKSDFTKDMIMSKTQQPLSINKNTYLSPKDERMLLRMLNEIANLKTKLEESQKEATEQKERVAKLEIKQRKSESELVRSQQKLQYESSKRLNISKEISNYEYNNECLSEKKFNETFDDSMLTGSCSDVSSVNTSHSKKHHKQLENDRILRKESYGYLKNFIDKDLRIMSPPIQAKKDYEDSDILDKMLKNVHKLSAQKEPSSLNTSSISNITLNSHQSVDTKSEFDYNL